MSAAASIRVGAAQLPAIPLDRHTQAYSHIERAVSDAGDRGLDLLVLPECAYPAYALGSAVNYRGAGADGGEAFVARLGVLAKKHTIQLVCGFVDDRDDVLRNCAVIIDATGRECGRHTKSFLWGEDNAYFTPSESLAPIDTPLGKIGVIICADGRAPEIAAGLVASGAQLIAVPTCWVNVAPTPGEYRNAQAEFMVAGRALECGVPFVAANKYGQENEALSYCGMSAIYDATAQMLAQAPPDESAIIDAEVTLTPPPAMEVPDWATRRIFSAYPPVEPDADELDTVKIAVVPAGASGALAEDDSGRDLFQRLADDGVNVVATSLSESDFAERLEIYGRSLGMAVVGFPFVERLMIERFGAFGCVASDHVRSFVPIRAMALDGASIVFVTGEEVPEPLLRTRAAENRIFIAAADDDSAILIDPAGTVIDRATRGANSYVVRDIDLRHAAHKEVFPNTHIWDQRRPGLYAKAFGLDMAMLR